jgi:signal transduction histidine kinase
MKRSQGTLFVIDDDSACRAAVAALAASMKIKCEPFASAEEFLERYDPSLTGCVLIDWRLGGMNGLQLQEQLCGLGSGLGVILVSANADVRMVVRAMSNGAVGVIEKPYDADDLGDLIHRAMEHSLQMQQSPAEKADGRDQRLFACDLHDGATQYLALAIMLLEQCEPPPNAQYDAVRATFDNGMRLLRRTMSELRSLICGTHAATGSLDVAGVLQDVASEFHDRLEIELVHDPAIAHLDMQVASALYRIVHELLTNAWRHSQSRKVRVDVKRSDGQLRVAVTDWGVGFDPAKTERGRFGLQGVRDRVRLFGGKTLVRSAAGEGTCVSVCLPLAPRKSKDSDAAVLPAAPFQELAASNSAK